LTTDVFKINKNKIQKLKEVLLQDPNATLIESLNKYEDFRIKYKEGIVVGYSSGKIVTNNSIVAKYVGNTIEWIETEEKDYSIMIGSDEAGKGEWLGPITISAVALSPEQSGFLMSNGVMDSKLLHVTKIIELAKIISMNCLSLKVLHISPLRFNQLIQEVRDEGKTLNDMLAWAHATVIENAYDEIKNQPISNKIRVVIDEFDKIKTEKRLWRIQKMSNISVEQRPTAEEEIAVAAAGIIVRAKWEEEVDKETRRLKIDLRSLSPIEAKQHPDSRLFAKISFLH